MRYFTISFLVTVAALAIAFWWAGWHGFIICALLTLMEVSFSFDNAVVNAAVLKHMDEKWQRRFLTWGILIAVFGMRLLCPILIVAFATGLHLWEVSQLAIEQPEQYSAQVLASHVQIGAFGGMFLLMVFLHFVLDEGKEVHWIASIERRLAVLGKLESVGVVIALIILLCVQVFLPEEERLHAMVAGTIGIILYVAVTSVTAMISGGEHKSDAAHAVGYSGLMGFIYLQYLDASYSHDGVIGAFAISKDIVIIMLGLGAGAMFVRSLTIYLVRKGTLDQYVFLEHGAHWGIAALAAIMLLGMVMPVPEVVTGLVGMAFIGLSLWSSVKYNRKMLSGGGNSRLTNS